MERFSELERENWDVTNMSTEEKLPLLESEGTNCTKCKSLVRPPEYIASYDVLHFVCESCGYEWVE
jgi:DNA-directed RNA polymerase subunit M/transcription elongation factor TFIIS